MSILGFDDLPQAGQRFPGLTTVRQPLYEMGRQGTRNLLTLVNGQQLIVPNLVMPTTLISRGTVGPPPT